MLHDFPKKFQSLIGRLKTWYRKEICPDQVLFQSLIGRLKTQSGEDTNQAFLLHVSIPHR